MCRLIEAGIGVVPESAARRHAQTMNISMLELEDEWALRNRSVLVRNLQTLPRSAQELIEILIHTGAGGGTK
jgi:DNA-binding transcriptional LysR family regulator